MGGTMDGPEADSWSQPNLIPILWTLKTLSTRLREVAATLVRQTQGKDASRTLAALQRAETKIWAIAGELLGVQKRLQAVGTEPGLSNSSAAPQDVSRLKGATELLAVIKFVLAGRLEPGISPAPTRYRRRSGAP
jgi:hypothetical protein